ncbi:glycosyltransferase [Ramlibacter rhizophilus]|nr:glycosyltransferase [Ramlibacter rhizophilus]
MRFLIVTPVFNGRALIERTIRSVALQCADPRLQVMYIVRDGGSTDGTPEFVALLAGELSYPNLVIRVYSEPDSGMYDALSKGFSDAEVGNADVLAYVNAGDYYAPRAFSNVSMALRSGHDWVTGLNVKYNDSGDIISARLPGPYPRRLIDCGQFGLLLPCVQQESTFWSRRAHSTIDLHRLKGMHLAGDYYLWRCISAQYRLRVISLWLGGFTIHEGQLSAVHRLEYLSELRGAADTASWLDKLYAVLVGCVWLLPDSVRIRLFAQSILTHKELGGET